MNPEAAHRPIWNRIAAPLGFLGGLLLITFPFLWLTLSPNYAAGTVQITWSPTTAFGFFADLLPVFLIAGLIFALAKLNSFFQISDKASAYVFSIKAIDFSYTPFILVPALYIAPAFLSGSTTVEWAATCLWMLLALGLNITVGLTGLLVLGYAGFYAFGAYAFAIAQQYAPFHITWWEALPVCFVLGGGLGFVVGLPCLRLRGDYLAIVTLGFAEAFRETMRNLDFTGSDRGIILHGWAGFQSFRGFADHNTIAFWVTLSLLTLTVIVVQRLRASPLGRAWVAIRENEIAAASMGIPVVSLKLFAFSLSAAIAASAGVIYDAREGFISPALCSFQVSIMILAMVILGGLGNSYGALLGAALLYLIPEYMKLLPNLIRNSSLSESTPKFLLDALDHLEDYRLLIFGIVMVVMMLVRPQGLLGSPRRGTEIREGA